MKKRLILASLLSFSVLVGCGNTSSSETPTSSESPISSEVSSESSSENTSSETKLLEFEGVTFNDVTVDYDGNEHTLTVQGAPDFATVSYSNAGPFTNKGEYVITAVVSADGYKDLELSATLTIADSVEGLTFEEYNRYVINKPFKELPYTIEAKIKLDKNVTGNAGTIFGNLDWIVYGGASVGVGRLYNIEIKDGILCVLFTNKYHVMEEIRFDGVDVRSDDYVHVSLSFDIPNRQILLYVNGEYKTAKVIKSDFSDNIKESRFHIGGDNRTLNPNWFKGSIRELTLFKDYRTSEEVLSDYQNGVSQNEEGLIAKYYLSSDNVHADLTDMSGNNYWARYEDTWYDEQEISLDYSHSFAVVGDTQMLNYWAPGSNGSLHDATKITNNMNNLYKWILDNQESQKIQHVFALM